ncbi:unnamed protein product [Paramecium sonneborni]|uniref:Uncharacterized protein n=1 Tax=Paramecium sonneborni TaxID=65129 RepID=A0A8S1MP18_9CILI|nr:unnamed protein product [Paramecium sonneborni]
MLYLKIKKMIYRSEIQINKIRVINFIEVEQNQAIIINKLQKEQILMEQKIVKYIQLFLIKILRQ